MPKLGRTQLQDLIQQGEDAIAHGTCYTCECFLGYLAQLRIDSEPADQDLFVPFKVDRSEMHRCIGCDPCPPADVYAEYIKKKQNPTLIQL
ncbi:MAG: hypothetical protein ACM3XO_28120 [Bacteroidota bacterium]|jgi:hypothetical protein